MSMDNFEDQLRQALRPGPAPPDFAANVIARARASRHVIPFPRRAVTLALVAALLLAAIIPIAIFEQRRRQQQRALEAREQLVTALTITRTQLRRVSAKIQRTTRRPL
jgi:hypothetical protein